MAGISVWLDVFISLVTPLVNTLVKLMPVFTLVVAIWATYAWRRTLRNQRADDCISAAREMYAAIEYVIRLKLHSEDEKRLEDAYNRAWETSWRRFDAAYTVAQRWYGKKLPAGTPARMFNLLFAVGMASRGTLRETLSDAHAEQERRRYSEKIYDDAEALVMETLRVLAPRVRAFRVLHVAEK